MLTNEDNNSSFNNPYTIPTQVGKNIQTQNSLSPELMKNARKNDTQNNSYSQVDNGYVSTKAKTSEKPSMNSDPRIFRDSHSGTIRSITNKPG